MKHYRTTLLLLACLAGLGAQSQEPQILEDELQPQKWVSKFHSTNHTLRGNLSLGWITSEVATPRGKSTWQQGFGYEVGYRYLSDKGYGFSLDYAHSQTDYSGGYELGQNSVLASFVYGGHLGEHLLATLEAGLGYANCTDGHQKRQNGLGTRYAVSLEYQLSPAFGLGLSVTNQTSVFSKDDDFRAYYNDDRANGFSRFSINMGLRIYL